jgi:hypothetical protein
MIFIQSYAINDVLLKKLSSNEPNPKTHYLKHKVRLHFLKLIAELNIWLWMLPFIKGWRGVEKYTVYTNSGLPDWAFGCITPTLFGILLLFLIFRVRNELGYIFPIIINPRS